MADGDFLGAHEAFEDLWNAAQAPRERDLWQGLAQLAAALLKHVRGESSTAISLLAKARARLIGACTPGEAGAALLAYLDDLASPVTCERDLPSTALPAPFLGTIRGL